MKGVIALVLVFAFAGSATGGMRGMEEGKIPVTTKSPDALKEYLRGQELADNLQAVKSLSHFDKAIALDPSFASAYLARSNNSFTTKEFLENLKGAMDHRAEVSEGERLLILAADAIANANSPKQKEYLETAVKLYPNDERAHVALGNYFFAQQLYRQAIGEFEQAIHLSENFAPAYNILGYAYRQIENYPKAEQTFKKYAELVPNDANPYDSYAELLLKIGRFKESTANYAKALAIDPTFASSQIGLVMNDEYQGDYEQATRDLKHLMEISKTPGEKRQALFAEAVVNVDAGKMDLGLQALDSEFAVGKRINDAGGMSGDLAAKANILMESGNYDAALRNFQASMELIEKGDFTAEFKKNADIVSRYNLSRIAAARGDLATAKSEADEYTKGIEVKKNPNQIQFSHELQGIIALAEKNNPKAVTELLQANQQNAYNLYRLALAYQGEGDMAHAKEYAKKAAEFYSIPSLNYAFIRNKAVALTSSL